MLEVTYDPEDPIKSRDGKHESIFSFLKLLPSIPCASPAESMEKKGITYVAFIVKSYFHFYSYRQCRNCF